MGLFLAAAQVKAASLIHFKSGVELTNPKDIKGASLQYCVELLRNREPKSEFKVDVELKESVHMTRMNETVLDDIDNLTVTPCVGDFIGVLCTPAFSKLAYAIASFYHRLVLTSVFLKDFQT